MRGRRAICLAMTVLLWFKRDLRIHDHAPLTRAAELDVPVLPIYIIEPEYWALPDTSARQWEFTAECLQDLHVALGGLGSSLVMRMGDAVEVIEQLVTTHGVTCVLSHEETGNLWTFARDRRVAAALRAKGVEWQEFVQSGVVRRLRSRDGWAASRDRVMAKAQLPAPMALRSVSIDPGGIAHAQELGMAPDPCPARQSGGRSEALSLLGGFLTERGQTYRSAMSSPLAGEWACSRLSPFIAMGCLSARETVQANAARRAEVAGTRSGWIGSLKSFEARLAWRDHFTQKLEDEPQIEIHCLHRAYETLRPRGPDAVRLKAWADGQTGLPFVDACMRFLRQTGWLNFRMRSMVMAVASYHLWLDWRATGPVLARLFTDYEPGIHWPQVQMQSGTTGMNTVRIYNPVKQGHDQDPDGIFTRRWVPELAQVPDRFLQEPWRWEGAGSLLGKGYPQPVVDVATAAKAAREAVWALRKGDPFRAEAGRILTRHASRKDSAGRFINDRVQRKRPRRKPKDDDQLTLDI